MSARAHALFWLALFAAFFAALWILSEILLPFVAGIAIAYLLDPLVDRLETWRVPRSWGSLIVLVLFLLVILLVDVLYARLDPRISVR